MSAASTERSGVVVRSGLADVLLLVLEPSLAFGPESEHRRWAAPLAVAIAIALVGFAFSHQAVQNVLMGYLRDTLANDPNMINVPQSTRASIAASAPALLRVDLAMIPITLATYAFFQTVLLYTGTLIVRRRADFAAAWAAVCRVAIIGYGANSLVQGIIVAIRGPGSFTAPQDLFFVIPSVAWLAPAQQTGTLFLYSTFNPIWLYATVLLAIAITKLARTRWIVALACAVVIEAITSVASAAFVPNAT